MPFTMAPIACSRIPNAMLRPACVAVKTPPPLNSAFVDSTTSAAPPLIVGAALGADAEQRRLLRLGLCVRRRFAQRADIVCVVHVLHVPALRVGAGSTILGEGGPGRPVDGDVVVVVVVDELPEAERAGDR